MTSLRYRLALTAGSLTVAMASACTPRGPESAPLSKEVKVLLEKTRPPRFHKLAPGNVKSQARGKGRTSRPSPSPGRPTAGHP
jgi:hypothetical protein